ncbi:MAG: TPM domain-containing protein [Acidobacteria bacterium]|nr:TPM domain-containing protein [Acidobacteriota bacterium]
MQRIARLLPLLVLAPAAFSLDPKSLKPEGYVSDYARVIDGAARAELEVFCGRLERLTGAQMALVTIDTLGGDPIEDFANDLYRHWGIGQKGKDEGLLLILAINDHRSRLEVGRGLEPVITDGTAGSVLREMAPALRANNYGEAMLAAARHLGQRIAQAKGVDLGGQPAPRRARRQGPDIPWPLLIGGLLLLFWMLSFAGRGGRGGGGFLAGMLLGNLMNRGMYWGGGRSSGGGFGGYDSGDSFGGFGGGDSGGGGASGSW